MSNLKGYGRVYSNGQTYKERLQIDKNIAADKRDQYKKPIR
jgi:hypothetical protein